jgi:Autotransporter beta-domain
MTVSNQRQRSGFDFNEEGFVIGKGFALSPNLTLGGGISNLYTVTSGGASTVDGTSVGAQVYGLYTAGPATISASAMAGHLGTNISRGLPTLGETAKATSTGAYEAAALHLQYNLLSGSRFFVAPYVSVSYLHTGLGGATETGAGIRDLHYDAMSTRLAELGAGVSGGLSMPVQYGTLTAWAGLGGEGTLGNPHISDNEVLGSFSAGESALAAPVSAFTPAVGVELTGRGPWRLAAAWGGQFGSATSAENFSLQARYVW